MAYFKLNLFLSLLLLFIFSIQAVAQQSPDPSKKTNNPLLQVDTTQHVRPAVSNPPLANPSASVSPSKYNFLTSFEFILSISVLIFGLIVVLLEIYLVKNKQIEPDTLVKFIVVTLIITGTLFLITAGYNNNQIAPAVGLFGTVAGYLLGKSNSKVE